MENESKSAVETPAPVNNAPPMPQMETKKKASPWIWIISGCLIIAVLTMVMFGVMLFWGYHKAKQEIKKQQPNIENFQNQLEQTGKNAEEWNKKTQELQKNIPAVPENLTYPAANEETPPTE